MFVYESKVWGGEGSAGEDSEGDSAGDEASDEVGGGGGDEDGDEDWGGEDV